ncbi:hypothetical protein [Sphaerimonospora thailandensis]|uniref:Thymidylate kinase n=1 Tax=Sphaerimonospora thailandensis TaxID=795644 RepID=A0A8J3RAT7_9ACTN|nr:hypothetical protein [Sphaerimonospora thailandensis]GIH70494.1 hypothetical protein Mth01_27470 [Sphaerimonospora thailandensis]
MPDRPRFESLEGLRGTGKSTIAPLLAVVRKAVLIPTIPIVYQRLRREVDRQENVEARMCLYLSALFAAAEEIQGYLDVGIPVVVESYFARCLATHQAFGAQLGVTLPSDLPMPVTYQLLCAEGERRRRLIQRDRPASRWDVLSEDAAELITTAYTQFPMHRVDTTGLAPDQVVQAIINFDSEGARFDADMQPVGADTHVLPPVPRRAESQRLP